MWKGLSLLTSQSYGRYQSRKYDNFLSDRVPSVEMVCPVPRGRSSRFGTVVGTLAAVVMLSACSIHHGSRRFLQLHSFPSRRDVDHGKPVAEDTDVEYLTRKGASCRCSKDPVDWYGRSPLPDDAFFFTSSELRDSSTEQSRRKLLRSSRVEGHDGEKRPVRPFLHASATLHTDSNPCYDSALFIFLASWTRFIEEEARNPLEPPTSQEFMLVLYSTPELPDRVAEFIERYNRGFNMTSWSGGAATNSQLAQLDGAADLPRGRIVPIKVPEVRSYIVLQERWRKCATKIAIWNQTDFEYLTYYDSDHIFISHADDSSLKAKKSRGRRAKDSSTAVSAEANTTARKTLVYASGDQRQGKNFNAGRMLVRPHRSVYERLLQLYNYRLALMTPPWDALMSGDQRFLNAMFPHHWRSVDDLPSDIQEVSVVNPPSGPGVPLLPPVEDYSRARHSKVWKWATFPNSKPWERDFARKLIDTFEIKEDIKVCLEQPYAYGNAVRERPLVEWW
jgi:hypothetical protein